MLPLIELLTCVWLAGCAAYSAWSLTQGSRHSIHYAVFVLFLFCGVPLALNWWLGNPSYRFAPNLQRVTEDATTALIYCAYVSAVPILWYVMMLGARPVKGVAEEEPTAVSEAGLTNRKKWTLWLLYAVMISPCVVVLFAPNPALYLDYAPFVRVDQGEAEMKFQGYWMSLASLAAICSCAVAMVLVPRITLVRACLFAACMFQGVWMQGKRFSIALAIVCVVYALWHRGVLRGKRLAIAGLMAVVAMGSLSYWYQDVVRGQNVQDSPDYYDGYRADFGRDAVIKQAIYAELHLEEGRILQYRGQSLVFLLSFLVPRAVWPEKPWPYTIYATATMLGDPDPAYIGYGTTTSILDESLANFGWLGLLAGPWIVGALCRLGDRSRWPLVRLLTAVIAPLLLVLDVAVYFVVFFAWLAMAWYSRSRGGSVEGKGELAEA